jgi:hypothetical protein
MIFRLSSMSSIVLKLKKGGLMEGGGVPHQPTHSLPLETLPGCLPRARNLKNVKTF